MKDAISFFCYNLIMDLASALLIHNLDVHSYSRNDLDESYKRLVKKYHPDLNQDWADWCHERMVEINRSYEMLMEHLEARPPKEKIRENKEKPKPKREAQNADKDIFFRKATTVFFEGVKNYYAYGLTKRSIRRDGVWRFHYRKSIKMMQKSLDELGKKFSGEPNWDVFMNFASLFLADVQTFEPVVPLSERGSKTHIAYSEAVIKMDKAFSEYFEAPKGNRESHLSPLYRASHLLILLVENYPQTEWYVLSMQKLNLLDSFLDLQEPIRSGQITF